MLLSFHPSLCLLLLPNHRFPQTMLFILAALALLAMTYGTLSGKKVEVVSTLLLKGTKRQAKAPNLLFQSWT